MGPPNVPAVRWDASPRSLRQAMNRRLGDGDRETEERRTAALIGLIIVLALAIAGIVLIRDLGQESRLEDCLMSGRTNCAPIEVPPRP